MSRNVWKELGERKQAFLDIVQSLVDIDTESKRCYPNPEGHHLRSALAVSDPDWVRIFFSHWAGGLFVMVVELSFQNAFFCTAFMIEDGYGENSTLCTSVTDLYNKHAMEIQLSDCGLQAATLEMMSDI